MQTRKVFIVTVYYVQLFAENIHLLYKICNLPDTHSSLGFGKICKFAVQKTSTICAIFAIYFSNYDNINLVPMHPNDFGKII